MGFNSGFKGLKVKVHSNTAAPGMQCYTHGSGKIGIRRWSRQIGKGRTTWI